jgi:hypothetical protein
MHGSDRRKWLGRSLGELVVIIAGVMIALAADRWIAGIDERAEARSYVSRLAENLRSDSARLEEWVQSATDRRQIALDMLLYAETGEFTSRIGPDSLLRMLVYTSVPSATGAYATETWQDLVATGNVELLDDIELRDSLSVYYNEVERSRGVFASSPLGNATEAADVLWELQSPLQMLTAVRREDGRAVFLPPDIDGEYMVTADQAMRILRTLRTRKDFLTGIGRQRQLHTSTRIVSTRQLRLATWLLERLGAQGG